MCILRNGKPPDKFEDQSIRDLMHKGHQWVWETTKSIRRYQVMKSVPRLALRVVNKGTKFSADHIHFYWVTFRHNLSYIFSILFTRVPTYINFGIKKNKKKVGIIHFASHHYCLFITTWLALSPLYYNYFYFLQILVCIAPQGTKT